MPNNNVSLMQHLDQFDLKHGNNAVTVDGWLLFADGAMREINGGQLKEPPADPFERSRVVVRYTEAVYLQSRQHLNSLIPKQKTPREVVAEFDKENGGEAVEIDGYLVFGNGAKRDTNILGVLLPPPSNPIERCKIQVKYREERLRRASEEFQNLKEMLKHQAKEAQRWAAAPSPPAPPSEQDIERLKQLQLLVNQRREELAAIRAELESHKPEHERVREAEAIARRELSEKLLGSIDSFVI